MKLIDRYDFTNDRSFITYYLSPADTARMRVADCDVIGLRRRIIGTTESGESEGPMTVMRPDEALIMARMLIDAVSKVTEGYTVSGPKVEELNFSGIPIVSDPAIPQDEIHLRQSGKTEAVFRISDREE